MKNETLSVAEVFYSIQGEGQTAGTPAVFLRLAGCNLLCDGKWRCDTIEVWKKGKNTRFEEVFKKEEVEAMARGAHLVITGGEPLLQQATIVEFLWWFATTFGWRPIVEVETNGTIRPNDELSKVVTYWNVSPKLSNSGEPYEKRVVGAALGSFMYLVGVRNVCYKFVINDAEDIKDIEEDYGTFIDMKRVWLMPAGESQEQLAVTRPIVAELCKQLFLNYSERLHIGIWNKKTGV